MKEVIEMKKIVNWKTFFFLLAACVVASMLVMPYQIAVNPALADSGVMLDVVALIQGLVIFSIATFFGLVLARKAGFQLPILEGDEKIKRLKAVLMPSILWGLLGGALITVCAIPFGDTSLGMFAGELDVPVWARFLAIFYGGIAEEVLLRLFVMSLLVWVFMKIKMPRNVGIWAAIIIATVLFGLGHLPLTGEITTITAGIVARALLLNGIVGIICSLLYWKKGLESAMIAHFSADIIVHFITPLIAGLLLSA